jgi:exosortase O
MAFLKVFASIVTNFNEIKITATPASRSLDVTDHCHRLLGTHGVIHLMLSQLRRWSGSQWWTEPRDVSWVAHLVLLVVWLYLNLTPLQWIGSELRTASLFNQVMFATVAGWLAWQGVRQRQQFTPTRFNANPWAGALLLGSALAAVVLPHWVDLAQLKVCVFVLGSYGWLGLILNAALWQRGLVIATLISMLLPFSLQQSAGLGFPLRVLTAQAVEVLLRPLHLGLLSSQDILVMENRIALVDLPCSGLNSMWMGSLFLLVTSGLQGRLLGLRWFLVAALQLVLLLLANIARVLALVLLTTVWNQPQLGAILHVPLGLIGFVLACSAGWWSLRWVPELPKSPKSVKSAPPTLPSLPGANRWRQSIILPLVIAVGILGLSMVPKPEAVAVADLQHLTWPSRMVHQPLPLSSLEQRFFERHAQTQVQKQKFSYSAATSPLSGSMLLVSSRSWLAQHAPEACFVGNGYEVNHLQTKQLAEVPVRWLDLNGGQYTATYWFQSQQQTTPNFLTRMWGQIGHRNTAWVMVSLVFDQPHQPQEAAVQDFVRDVHQTLQQNFTGQA